MANYGPPGGPYPGSPGEPWPDPDQAVDEYGQPVDPWGDHDQSGVPGQWGGGAVSTPPASSGSPVGHPGYPGSGPAGYPGPGAGAQRPEPGYPPTRQHAAGYAPGLRQPGGSTPFDAPPAGWTPSKPESAWAAPTADPNWSTPVPEPRPARGRGRVLVLLLTTLAVLAVAGAAIGIYLLGGPEASPDERPTAGPTEDPAYPANPTAEPAPTTPSAEASGDVRFVKVGQCVANRGTEAEPKLFVTACAPETYDVLARIDGATTGETDAQAKCAKVENYTNFYFYNTELDDLDFVLCLRKR